MERDYYGNYSCQCCGACYGHCCCGKNQYIPVMVGPIGPTGATGPNGIAALNYGSLLLRGIDFLDLTATPTVVPMTVPSGEYEGVDYSNTNAITIVDSGVYRVDVLINGLNLGQQTVVVVDLAVNGVRADNMEQGLTLEAMSSATYILTNYLSLTAGDVLTVRMSAGQNMTFYFAVSGTGGTLTVQRIK